MKLFTKKLFAFFASFCFILNAAAQTADFTSDVSSGCSPLKVSFTDKSTGSITSWTWDFGDSKTSTLASPSTTYVAAGTYTVKLTVKNGSGGSSTKTKTITVYPSPTISYTSTPLTGCPGTTVTFTNGSTPGAPGAYTTIWSFGDGYTATTNSTSHTYYAPGSYNIALKVTNSVGCESTRIDTGKVVITEKPKANFGASKVNLCKLPDTTYFTNFATGGKSPYTFNWDFGDGIGTSALPNPQYSYAVSGSYTVRLIVTDANGCKDTISKVNFIKAVPMVSDFKVPASICPGVTKVLFESSSVPVPLTTTWYWSDGGSASGLSTTRDYWKGGTYTVTMIDSFGPGCKDTAVKNYTVHKKPRPNFSYSPIYPCPAPATITFTNKSNDADSFYWIFGDGTNSRLKDPVHTYTRDSIFTVFMIAKTSFGCLDTFRVRDTTYDFPGGYPKVRGTKFKLPTYDSTNSPVIIRVHPGDLQVSIEPGGGCVPFTIKPIALMCGMMKYPADTLSGTSGTCAPGTPLGYSYPPYWKCAFDGSDDPYADEYADPYFIKSKTSCATPFPHPYPISKYKWDFGDGTPISTVDSPTHTYYVEGTYNVTVTVETHNGCTYTETMTVMAGNRPTADFTAAPLQVCIHDSITVTNKSHGGATGYVWRFGDGEFFATSDSTAVHKHAYSLSDTFRILLYASRMGCQDTFGVSVIVHPPEVRQEFEYFCDSPMKVRFIDTSVGATSYLWRFGDGTTSTAKKVTHTYPAEGKYRVTQIVYNNIYNCSDSVSFDVDIFTTDPFFYTKDTTYCIGDSVVLLDSVRSYYVESYWFTSDYTYETTGHKFVVPKYNDTGRYDVKYIALDKHGCRDTMIRKNYIVVSKPQMKIVSSPMVACSPASVLFTDNSTNLRGVKNTTRTWFWEDMTTKTDTGIYATKLFSAPGVYRTKLVTTDINGCKDSIEMTIEARKPIADFVSEVDTYACAFRPVKFGSFSKGVDLTCFWDFGDGGTGTGDRPEHTYKTIGTFTVKLVVTDKSGCKDSLTKIAFIKTVKPKADFTMSDSVALCPPLFVNFTNTSSNGAMRYFWDFDNGSTSIVPSPVAPFVDSGVYTIMLVAFDKYGCTDTAYKKARVLGYDGLIKYEPLIGCAPHTVNFEVEAVNAEVMIWDFADGVTESAVGKLKTSHTYYSPGAYVPRLILGNGKGCSTASKGLDTIKVDGTIAVISNSPACINTPITFNDSSYSYFSTHASSEWIFEDGTTATGKNPKRTYSKIGSYKITLITTNTNGCKDTVEKTITISPLPTIKAIDTVICRGDEAMLFATGGVSYKWDPSPTLSCTDCNNPLTKATVPARYFVTGTDANGCSNRDTLDLGIKTKTTLILAEGAEVCELTPVQLIASGAQTYVWSPETYLNNPNVSDPIATMEKDIVYRVIGTEGSCIPDTGFIKVTVHPLPDVNAGADQKVLAGTEVQLSGSGTHIKDYLWTPAATLSCSDCPNPIAKPAFTTTYTLRGTSEYGCSDTDDVVVAIFCDQSQLFIPNTFTPNGDGQNDYFYPQGKGVSKIKSMIIFNRWGQKVFVRSNIDANIREQGWDGTFNGDPLSPDTFVYTIEATCDNGEIVFLKGDVTLIK